MDKYLLDDHIYNLHADLEYFKTEYKLAKKYDKDTSELRERMRSVRADIKFAKHFHLADKVDDLRILEFKIFNNFELDASDFYGLKTRLAKIDRTQLGQVLLGIELIEKTIDVYKG